MHHVLRERIASVLPLLAASAIVPAALIHFFGTEEVQFSSEVHFLPIAISAGLAAAAAVALTVAGARRGDSRAVLVGTAFSSMAALLAVHGLTTPGLLAGENGVVAFSGAATLPVGGAVMALSVLPAIKRPEMVRMLLWLQGILLVAIIGLGTAGILAPSIVPSVPETGSTAAWIVLAVGLAFYGTLAVRAARTFLLTHRGADLLVVFGTVLLCVALPAALLLSYMDLGWWMGHALRAGRHRARLRPGRRRPASRGTIAAARGRPAGDRDRAPPPTRSSARRSGRCSSASPKRTPTRRPIPVPWPCAPSQVGEELGLSPGRLRELAIGAMVHDVGKLSVPDAILQKPGGARRRRVRRHPAAPRPRGRNCSKSSAASRRSSSAWCSTITSGSTAAATRAA